MVPSNGLAVLSSSRTGKSQEGTTTVECAGGNVTSPGTGRCPKHEWIFLFVTSQPTDSAYSYRSTFFEIFSCGISTIIHTIWHTESVLEFVYIVERDW